MNNRPHLHPPRASIPPPTQAQIAALAHEIWLERGSPAGSDIDIWLEAERQLTGQAPLPTHVDPIPADMSHPGLDHDPAVNAGLDGNLVRLGHDGTRSSTSFGL